MSTFKRRKRRQSAPKVTPEQQKLFDELVEALEKTGLQIYIETGNFTTGFCIVDGCDCYYINRTIAIDRNIDLMLAELQKRATEEIYLSPRMREMIGAKDR